MRGGESRGLGRPRGSKNKSKTELYEYTIYKPEPEIYDELFRLPQEAPVITRSLPKQCPIANAESTILSRRQVEGTSRYYYNVRIKYHLDEATSAGSTIEPREEVAQIEMSQILKYVSRRELERFEQEDYRQQAEAEEIVRRADAEEAAKRRLARNARATWIGRGASAVNGLGPENSHVSIRTRGRPRGRGRRRGRGRGWARGRGGFATATDYTVETADLRNGLLDPEVWESAILDTSEDEEDEDEINLPSNHPSPNFAVSSFVAKSALPLSPVAAHRRLSKTMPMRGPPVHDENQFYDEDSEGDTRSLSSAAAQLQFERNIYGKQLQSDDEIAETEEDDRMDDMDRHRTKRRRTKSATSTSGISAAPRAQQSSAHTFALPKPHLAETVEYSSDDDAIYEHPMLAQRPPKQRRIIQADDIDSEPPKSYGYNRGFDKDDQDMTKNTGRDTEDDAEEEYVVEAILSHMYEDGQKFYLVKWEGYEDSSDWLPEEDLTGAIELVNDYNARVRKKKGKQAVR